VSHPRRIDTSFILLRNPYNLEVDEVFWFDKSCRRYIPEFYDFLEEFNSKHLDQFLARTLISLFQPIFTDSILPAALWTWECTESLTEVRTEEVFSG
jgi:hypothetical protein